MGPDNDLNETNMAIKTGKGAGQLQDAAGTVLLEIIPSGDRAWCFIEPSSGATVVLVCRLQMGNGFTGKRTTWGIWTAEDNAETGAPEATPIGTSMYKFGSLSLHPAGRPYEYLDPSGAKLFTAKPGSSSFTLIDGTDGKSPAAVVENIAIGVTWKGTCTFAKGVDPIVAIIMGVMGASMSGGY